MSLLQLALIFFQVKSLYLPPTTLLRYETSRPPWTKEEAFRDTRLVFVVLDTTFNNSSFSEVQWMNISLKEDLGVSIIHILYRISSKYVEITTVTHTSICVLKLALFSLILFSIIKNLFFSVHIAALHEK